MAKVFVPRSSCVYGLIIFVLLVLSIGLLVFVLKGQIQHEKSNSFKSGHIKDPSVFYQKSTNAPSPQTAPKDLLTKPTMREVDIRSTTESSPAEPWQDFRLPKYIIPLRYELLLHPNIINDTFTGNVTITVNVTKNTNYFVVHAYKLVITDSKVLSNSTNEEIYVAKSFVYDPHEYFVVETGKSVEPGVYNVSFTFFGSLIGGIVGFYKSRYVDRSNHTRYLATSKFQPTYARRAFPCLDEPSFKSVFAVSLVHEPGYIALSNMPVEETKKLPESELLVTKFQPSVPMVTYLACFIVCDFDYVRTRTSNGKEFRVYSVPDQIQKTEHALKFGARVLDYFENYFGIGYPLPKQDMIAIPDFVSGAMEHWGLITYRETNLLYDEQRSSPQNLQRIFTVISHEMTHMWFGNLVTMKWWEDLWLNEGFASYVEYKGVHQQHPEWDMLSQFITEDVQPVMDIDSTMSSHPIVQRVEHPDEITEIFDDISYGKGASVLRMLEFFVGEENFRKGISQYLQKYKFQNARTADLWEELSEACGYQGNRSIASIMKTWTEQMGYPFITIKRIKNDENSSVFEAKQQRFVKNEVLYHQNLNASKDEYIWSVPLSYITQKKESNIIWIHDDKETKFIVPNEAEGWIKFNVNQTGYYLVNYEKEEWDRLIEVLLTNHEVLSPSDRSNLLFDAYLLAEAGHIPFDIFLSMSMYLKNETHLVPWATAYHSFVYLCQILEFTDVNYLLKSYIQDLTSSMYNKLGWKKTDNHLDNLLRTTIIGLACHSGNKDCLADASELFQNWTQGQEIPSSLKSLVYHYGMAEIGHEEHWNYMWNKYLNEEMASEKKTLLYGLAHIKIPKLLHRYLKYAMDEKKVRRQDFFTVLNYIAGNSVGRSLVWNFLRENWPAFVERFTLNDRYLGLAVKKICSYFTADHELQEMKEFFVKYPDAGAGKRRRQQALENVQNNIKWLKSNKERVKTWLEREGTAPWRYYRLPSKIIPVHYDLLLYPMLDKDKFNGFVTITVNITKPSEHILLHSVDLNVTRIEVRNWKNDSKIDLDEVFDYNDNDYLVLKIGYKLPIGKYKVYLEFEGNLSLSLKGLYKSSYLDPETKDTRYIATTQFQAIGARKAFPCFDEPVFKSTFSVRVLHSANQHALSNTNVKEIINLQNGLLETRFEKTFPMVTYLLAIFVSDFKYKETITDHGVQLRAYSAPHLVDKLDYPLNVASRILTYFESYFDVPFPLKKLDLVAVPDFPAGGMENWGLVTFEESILVADNTSSTADQRTCVAIIAHELAHMWFGDLVTMKWWDDLWLNEGFATYISYKGVKYAEPDFDSDGAASSKKIRTAMLKDNTVNSHPIVQKVTTVKSNIFDSITYSKGSAVLGMIENYMGDDFRQGVSNYLKKYSYGSARTEDLWNELSNASTEGLNISYVMETWTKQMNYPYITVHRRPGNSRKYDIVQRRFLEDPSTEIYSTTGSPFNYVWRIPITYRTSDSAEVHHLFLNSSETVTVDLPESEWIKFNVNFTGYYSVNYDIQDWRKFVNIMQKDPKVLSGNDRVNLLFDSFSLASAGYLDYEIPLNMTKYLGNETDYGAWVEGLRSLSQIKLYFKNDKLTKDIVKEYIRSLLKKPYREYLWHDNGKFQERKLRHIAIEESCRNGNFECLMAAGNMFKQWMNGIEPNSEVRDLVFTFGIRVLSDEASWNFVWKKYLEEDNPDIKNSLLTALTACRNVTLLERFLQYSKNETLVRKHSYYPLLTSMVKSQKGFSLVTSLIFNNWTELLKIHGSYKTEKFVSEIFGLYDTEKDLKKVKEFYRKNKETKEGQIHRTNAIERILQNIRWHQMHSLRVKNWFLNNVHMPWRMIRLPQSVKPSAYNIILHPNITNGNFKGEVEILVNVTESTDHILIHENGLKITDTVVKGLNNGSYLKIDEAFSYSRNHFWVIQLFDIIPLGQYSLHFKFSGTFSNNGHGVSSYHYVDKKSLAKRQLVATMFEPTDARSVFPCFDEPDMKAKFKLSIVHAENYTAVSNMPEESKNLLSGDLVETVFEETPEMSTYLLSFVISDFTYIEKNFNGKKIRVYAASDRLDRAEYGLNLTSKILGIYEEYFGISYVLPKLDSVVIPNYTVPAMEHWGIIIYHEKNFLNDDSYTPEKRLFMIDMVIAHELAHQWVGNLVTMKWWNDLWLNEGFSTLMMYMSLKEYHNATEELDVRKISKMMCIDSSMDSRAIRHEASDPSTISNLFDNISYEKGNAVLKMLQYIMKDDFRKGLSNYLKKYAFKNAETKDVWEELMNASKMHKNITLMMDTWTCQMGFPYVELKREGEIVKATQRWFLRKLNDTVISDLSQDKTLSPYGFIWDIPLIYKNLETNYEGVLWLTKKSDTFIINAMHDDVVKFNPSFIGFYVVKYDEEDWERLEQQLLKDHTVFNVTDRYNLLHDAFLLAESNRLSYTIPMDLTKYLKDEKKVLPWTLFRDKFIHFLQLIDPHSETVQLLKEYAKYLTSEKYDEIMLAAEDNKYFKKFDTTSGSCPYTFRDLNFVSTIVDIACHSSNEDCLKRMNHELQLWLQGKNCTADVRMIFSIALPRYGNITTWDIMYEKFKNPAATESERRLILEGLASFSDPAAIKKTIYVIQEDPRIDSEMARIVFNQLAENSASLDLLWDYTKKNWNSLAARFELHNNPTAFLSVFCHVFRTHHYLGELIRFAKAAPQLSDYCLEDIQDAIRWSSKYEQTLQNWLQLFLNENTLVKSLRNNQFSL